MRLQKIRNLWRDMKHDLYLSHARGQFLQFFLTPLFLTLSPVSGCLSLSLTHFPLSLFHSSDVFFSCCIFLSLSFSLALFLSVCPYLLSFKKITIKIKKPEKIVKNWTWRMYNNVHWSPLRRGTFIVPHIKFIFKQLWHLHFFSKMRMFRGNCEKPGRKHPPDSSRGSVH